jgi:hypothetical protein
LNTWINALPFTFKTAPFRQYYNVLIDHILVKLLKVVKEHKFRFEIETECQEKWLLQSMFKLFECFIYGEKTKEIINEDIRIEKEKIAKERARTKKLEGNFEQGEEEEEVILEEPDLTEVQIVDIFNQFLMSFIWSFGTVFDPT